jgi:uncharacterized membrane protein YcaP (DUF421 family)
MVWATGWSSMSQNTYFDSWSGLIRVVAVAPLAYAALVLTLRISGKRTLSKMNAFDLVVTVALGSTLATIILSKDVALAEGLVAFVMLVALQFVVSWMSVRVRTMNDLVKSEPTLLVRNGRLLAEQMRRARVVEDEVAATPRSRRWMPSFLRRMGASRLFST